MDDYRYCIDCGGLVAKSKSYTQAAFEAGKRCVECRNAHHAATLRKHTERKCKGCDAIIDLTKIERSSRGRQVFHDAKCAYKFFKTVPETKNCILCGKLMKDEDYSRCNWKVVVTCGPKCGHRLSWMKRKGQQIP